MDNSRLETLLAALIEADAAAVHLVPGRPACLRAARRVVRLPGDPVTGELVDEFVRDLLFSDHRATLAATGRVEVLYMGRDGRRYRAGFTECAGGRAMTLRPLPTAVPRLEDLELPAEVQNLVRHRSGLALVAGQFGAGRWTTMTALVDALNRDSSRHIVTIEDRIDVVHSAGDALLHQQELGTHVESVARGIRQAVALGADTVVVAELNDRDATEAALAAAESGCLVLCGIEAGTVVGALAALELQSPPNERSRLMRRLSRVLRGVTSQFLLPRADSDGQVPVVEILAGTPAVAAALRTGDLALLAPIMERSRGIGMQTAEAALDELQASGFVSAADARLYAGVDIGLGRAVTRI